MKRALIFAAVSMIATIGSAAELPASQPATQPSVDATAAHILQQSCDFLARCPAFGVHAEIWKDIVLPSGHKIQVTRSIDLDLRRPDRLHVDAHAHQKGRSIWYDGKSLTVLDHENNLFGTVDAPATIDQTLDLAAQKYGITIPLEDLAVADPYGSSMKNVNSGGYFGDEFVLGVKCRHVGFSTDQIDWQLWISDGPQPLPQKLVITYKNEEKEPQYIAIFSKWNLIDRAADLTFEFSPPRGSSRIDLVAKPATGSKP